MDNKKTIRFSGRPSLSHGTDVLDLAVRGLLVGLAIGAITLGLVLRPAIAALTACKGILGYMAPERL